MDDYNRIDTDALLAKLRQNLGLDLETSQPTPKKVDKQIALEQQAMANTPYNADYYNQAIKRVEKLKDYCQSSMKNKHPRADIIADIDSSAHAIMRDYHEGVKDQIKQLKQWQQDYIKYFKNKEKKYDSPQEELLHRQDWNSMVNAMDSEELADYIRELTNDDSKTLGAYEVNTLLSKTKNNPSLFALVKSYRNTKHVGSEWETTDAWQQVEKSLSILGVYQRNNILYDKPEEGEWISRKMIDPKEEAMSVLNSHPNNHSQYKVEHHQPVNIFE
ncbi:hypothetical protein LMC10_02435 [Limosilactobacillus reuteri]|uniref:hypothetical protein n=1 Tax=Limosilactobacillus reuteri TaxID=1598 RepID=UPI001E564111|nr:hypothetical protein [Limosilactobacillus reuteri]MCC4398949.1 hypothetical protein [Limosilactobacillus reuteri]MCC4402972.1 hypothetical protein [Limosilactobacillus reuteri]